MFPLLNKPFPNRKCKTHCNENSFNYSKNQYNTHLGTVNMQIIYNYLID